MDRTDSAFDETFRMVPSEATPKTTRKYKTASARDQEPGQNIDGFHPKDQTPTLSTTRPAPERPNATPRRSTEPRRKSITTNSSNSNSNSTRSRRRGHGSAPSSRRTSCTIIDPSRPKRHYRITSSQTCPTLNRDIDDVLALHFRSCSLFHHATHRPHLPSPTMSAHGPSVGAEIGATPEPQPQARARESGSPVVDEKTGATPAIAEDTTMHWMSPSTRKIQYEKIDRANTGVRGLLRRMVPRCVSGQASQQFYEEEKSDAGSVRRYRMDLEGEEDDAKSASGLKMQRRRLARSATAQRGEAAGKKVFGCF
ncbi:hypothetical protein P171DRAFT_264721 [Karstenula rhodostoma CBS 690.94]|uniref:Uncharacterized protein n=1 Tax=Karstenula rhodostoma CBS 690.94 TaxID=1392251 RepID=A0A9P4PJY0_9PLEO|nr:hypothetical protein P171DRAFT_264721 [Karstenula rhodostoma CBS 690.94]